jgi:hypothetical protein
VIGYFFQVSTRVAVARNKERTGKAQIPLVGIFGAYKRLELPSRTEGFDELFLVAIGADRDFIVNPAPEGTLAKVPHKGEKISRLGLADRLSLYYTAGACDVHSLEASEVTIFSNCGSSRSGSQIGCSFNKP